MIILVMNWFRKYSEQQLLLPFKDTENIPEAEPSHQYTTRFGKGIPPSLAGLVAEARKCDTWQEFEKDYLGQIKHGTYWHFTDNPNFTIDPAKGPRDMSSMAPVNSFSPGKLMITSNLSDWLDYGKRQYVAQIDMSMVPKSAYYQVNRGFGNEFWVDDPSKAKVIAVMPVRKAIGIDKRIHNLVPKNPQELEDFFYKAHSL